LRGAVDGLYRGLLGDAWADVPAVVQRVHAAGHATGRIDVERGPGWLARSLASLLSLPAPARAITVTLEVTERDGVQIWNRRFADHPLVSSQRACGPGQIAERLGPIECRLRLRACPSGIELESERAVLRLGFAAVPLPACAAPHIAARAVAHEDAVAIAVEIRIGARGPLLLRYAGRVQPVVRT
jgi:hypothetical protein